MQNEGKGKVFIAAIAVLAVLFIVGTTFFLSDGTEKQCGICPQGSEWKEGGGYSCTNEKEVKGACWSHGYKAADYFISDKSMPGSWVGCPKQTGCGTITDASATPPGGQVNLLANCANCPPGSQWWDGYGHNCVNEKNVKGACWAQSKAADYFISDATRPGWWVGCPNNINCGDLSIMQVNPAPAQAPAMAPTPEPVMMLAVPVPAQAPDPAMAGTKADDYDKNSLPPQIPAAPQVATPQNVQVNSGEFSGCLCPAGSQWWDGYGYNCVNNKNARGACWSQGAKAAEYFTGDPAWPGWWAGCPKQAGCGNIR